MPPHVPPHVEERPHAHDFDYMQIMVIGLGVLLAVAIASFF